MPRAPTSAAAATQSSRVKVPWAYSCWYEYRLTPRLMRALIGALLSECLSVSECGLCLLRMGFESVHLCVRTAAG